MSASPEKLNTCLHDFRPDGNQTSLHKAVRDADTDCVEILIDAGSEIDSYDHKDNTPLAIPLKRIRQKDGEEEAKAKRYCPVLKMLSERGADFGAVKIHEEVDERKRKDELKTIFENCINGNINKITTYTSSFHFTKILMLIF